MGTDVWLASRTSGHWDRGARGMEKQGPPWLVTRWDDGHGLAWMASAFLQD